MANPQVQMSSLRYSTANATTYRHVYIPFEYDVIPDPGILTHLLHLIRDRKGIFTDPSQMALTAVNFLLTGETDDAQLQVTDHNLTIDSILQRLLFHIFLDKLPECTPEQLARSVDNISNELFPPLPRFTDNNRLLIHTFKRNFETLPPRDWFNATRSNYNRSCDFYTDVGITSPLLENGFLFSPIATKANTEVTNQDLQNFSNGRVKTPDFWYQVFATP
jgi:hypothetical protein